MILCMFLLSFNQEFEEMFIWRLNLINFLIRKEICRSSLLFANYLLGEMSSPCFDEHSKIFDNQKKKIAINW